MCQRKEDTEIVQCYVCRRLARGRNLDLYVSGSEGTSLCEDCELEVLDHIRDLARVVTRAGLYRHQEARISTKEEKK